MVYKVVLKGKFFGEFSFPTLNGYLQKTGMKPVSGAKMKSDYQTIICMELRKKLRRIQFEAPVCFHYKFYEPAKARTRKRDFANIVSAFDKFFADAVVVCKYIEDDDPSHVRPFTFEVYYTDGIPYIEVYIEDGLPKDYQPIVYSPQLTDLA